MRLVVQFADEALDDFRWATFDETAASAEIAWQQASADNLDVIAAQNPHPVIIILPQQCIYLTEVELPEKAGRQVLSAIEYQIEDQLAQDIESQHFALGDTSQNPIAVAVVERDIMAHCIALAQSHDLRLIQVLPELFLCPWQGTGVALIAGYDGYLLRYGDYRGLKCNAQALPTMLALVKRDVEIDHIYFYSNADEPAPELADYDVEQQALDSARTGLVDTPQINLQQRDYQLSSAWQGLGKAWKWIALLFAALLIVGGYNKAVAVNELKTRLADIKQQQYELLKPYLPAGTQVDANLKKIFIERLKQVQAEQREQGFLKLLLDFTRARAKYPAVKISRVSYQGAKLSFDINSSQLTDIEALLETVKKQGVNVKLENLSIKPEQSSGRLVLQGGDNV